MQSELATRQALQSVSLFSELPEEFLHVLAARTTLMCFPASTLMVSAGTEADALYIILSGRAKVFNCDRRGRAVILSLLAPRDYFGEMALIDDQPRSASVATIEPCKVLRLAKEGFLNCMHNHRELTMHILRGLVMRLRGADRQIESLALMDTYGRVSRLLLDLAEVVDGKRRITTLLSTTDIASMVGASREMVSRIMRKLLESGYISKDRRGIVFRDDPPARRVWQADKIARRN